MALRHVDSVVCWLWKPAPGYRSVFGPEHINTLHRMVARHYKRPHRFIAVTDDAHGIEPGIEIIPLWTDHAELKSPHGGNNPACYRRLRAFSPEAEQYFGKRFVSIDLDTIIMGDPSPLWDRQESFVIWGDTNPKQPYNGSMFMLDAGARPQVWTDFDPVRSPWKARERGYFGTDQAWIALCLGPDEPRWRHDEGIYSYRCHIKQTDNRTVPAGARIISFHGQEDPWGEEAQRLAWVREHYRWKEFHGTLSLL